MPGSVGNIDLVSRLIDKPIAQMDMPDSCTPEMYVAYLRVQREARYAASSKAERSDRHIRSVIKNLCPRKPILSTVLAVGSAELKRQKDNCDKRATDRLALFARKQEDRLAWFKEADLALIKEGGPISDGAPI